jgi:PHD/YefM family antitoxin component YafN of YafNO toxin-antitoxin module
VCKIYNTEKEKKLEEKLKQVEEREKKVCELENQYKAFVRITF